MITPVRGSIINATRCKLLVTGYGFRVSGFGLQTAFCFFLTFIILYHILFGSLLSKKLNFIRVNSMLNLDRIHFITRNPQPVTRNMQSHILEFAQT